MTRHVLVAAAVLMASLVCVAQVPAPPFAWTLPPGFPVPRVPADNPMTAEKVALGRYLFYDTRLSLNGTQACASCHEQARAFTDGRPRAIGSTGEVSRRNSMSLVNVAYASTLTWANPALQGTVEEIQHGDILSHIVVRVGPNLIESVITRRSADEMALKKGDTVKRPS